MSSTYASMPLIWVCGSISPHTGSGPGAAGHSRGRRSTNYSIYSTDIKPKGFRVIEFDGYLTEDTVTEALRVIDEPALAELMAETNYRLARNYYSYAMLERRLQTLLAECFGEE